MTANQEPAGRPWWMPVPCSRLTRAGKPCPYSAHNWEWALKATGLPDPVSCRRHMTREEHEARRAGEEAWRRVRAEADAKAMPACWSWPVTMEHQERAFQASRDSRGHEAAMALIRDWQAGRCAICGRVRGESLMRADHDHDTGYFRGIACDPCNLEEGRAACDCLLFGRYRFRPPAAILGVRIYWAAPDSAAAWFAAAGLDPTEELAKHQRDTDPNRR